MSFADHAILWLHVTAAVFTIGPGTAAIMSTPRYIRKRNTVLVGYLFRTTRVYSCAALLTLIFGLILTGMTNRFSQWWISVSLTLFVVAFVLLVMIMRDQRKALTALEAAKTAVTTRADEATARSEVTEVVLAETAAAPVTAQPLAIAGRDLRVAAVERGRIASFGGVTAVIWLVILLLMAWH